MKIDRAEVSGWVRQATFTAAAVALGVAASAWLTPPPPVSALANGVQVLSGGNSLGAGIRFTAPGLGNMYGADFPDVGLGERAAQIRMPPGVLRELKVRLTTATVPSSGDFTVTIRRAGVTTPLECTIAAAALATRTANCTNTADSVTFVNGDRLTVMIDNQLVDTGNGGFTFTLEFN